MKMAKSPKILYITPTLLVPPHTGCMIRTMNVASQLQNCGQLTMLAVSRDFNDDSVKMAREKFENFQLIKLKDYSEYGNMRGRFLKKFHMHWPPSRGTQANDEGQKLFRELVASHDIVWFHTLRAAFPFRFKKLPKSVMDLDDLNHCKYTLRSGQDKTLRLRISSKVQSIKWKKHEFDALERYSKTVVCSKIDKELLGDGDNIHVVPNGFTEPQTKPKWQKPDELRLGFIGALAYGPNRDGLVWFRDHVWPLIRKQKPNMTLRIVGSPPPKKDVVEAEGFESLGYVDDPAEEFHTWSAMVVPLLFGGGTRIKIIESFSKMCPVISTTPGAHGIQSAHGENILLADDPEEFAQYCLQLSDSPENGKQMAEAGWQLFVEKYSWDVIGESIKEILDTLK